MNNLLGEQHIALEREFDSLALANAVVSNIVSPVILPDHKGFIESRDMFFLSTVDHRGFPTCSYKGGNPGFAKVVDDKTLVFPSYDGNGMFLSMGNISINPKIGILFIDLETPHRLRLHGEARISTDDALLKEFPEAEIIVRVTVSELFVNCPRYIHPYRRIATSKYIPQAHCDTPVPQWKRIAGIQEVLPAQQQPRVQAMGDALSVEDYAALVMRGEA